MSSNQPAAERPPAAATAGKASTRLDAPHKRRERGRGPRPLEKAAIIAYRAGMGVMSRLPAAVARWIVSFLLQAFHFLFVKMCQVGEMRVVRINRSEVFLRKSFKFGIAHFDYAGINFGKRQV